ncbi:ATP-binding protein [Streptomyces inusitatus]|uniref:ATP-binding protein n=2 Tax=Streptomyces inusitatus TaxID=68221 RepID=A0A918QHT1_9ACTN|nr:ATP-binding protein [Streptomyces inusitatus]
MEQIGLAHRGERAMGEAVSRAGVCYDGAAGSIAAARGFTAEFLGRVRGGAGVVAVAELVVSELVTNACKYAPGPCLVDLEVVGQGAGRAVEITVWDANPEPPVPCAAEPGRVGGHGLEIVLALSEGFDVGREPVGKRIRVRLPFGG